MSHGVEVSESATAVSSPVTSDAALPVYTGLGMINAGDLTKVNVPVLCDSLATYVENFGPIPPPDSNWGGFSLGEAAKAHFLVYEAGPIVCTNVLDPDNGDHVSQIVTSPCVLDDDNEARVEAYGSDTPLLGVLTAGLVVRRNSVSGTICVLDTDYSLSFDDEGACVITRLPDGAIAAGATLYVSGNYLDPSGVTADDIIGGYTAGVYTGLEVVKQVYPVLRKVAGFLVAPTWSQEPTVAARMAAIADSLNGVFRCVALCDLSTDAGDIAAYANAAAWKSDNGYNAVNMLAFWPLFKNGDDVYHLSTVCACRAALTDADHDDIPYASPSNKLITGTVAVNDAGTEIALDGEAANSLNDQGIITALNGFNGWKLWGNRTAAYPGTTDIKDAFTPQRRMGNYLNNALILTCDSLVDEPGNRRLIDAVVNTVQILINSWIAKGAMLTGSKVEFLTSDNPVADLLNGTYRFRVTQATPPPAQTIAFIVTYDTSLLAALAA